MSFLSKQSLILKLWEGMGLFTYFIRPKLFNRIANMRMALTSSLVVLMLISWYLSIAMTVLSGLNLSGGANGSLIIGFISKTSYIGYLLSNDNVRLFSSSIAIILSFIGLVVPYNDIADYIFNAKVYLREEYVRNKMRYELASIFHPAYNSGKYSKIKIVAFSFGSIVAIDFLSSYRPSTLNKKNRRPDVIFTTLGSPISLFTAISKSFCDIFNSMLDNSVLLAWVDYTSKDDWITTGIPFHENERLIERNSLDFKHGFWKKFRGKTHFMYFYSQVVNSNILRE